MKRKFNPKKAIEESKFLTALLYVVAAIILVTAGVISFIAGRSAG